jgi:hypothetical protein
MTKKKRVLNWWATKMRNPRSKVNLEYIGVSAPSIKALEQFYYAIFPDSIFPFNRKNCLKVRITRRKA